MARIHDSLEIRTVRSSAMYTLSTRPCDAYPLPEISTVILDGAMA